MEPQFNPRASQSSAPGEHLPPRTPGGEPDPGVPPREPSHEPPQEPPAPRPEPPQPPTPPSPRPEPVPGTPPDAPPQQPPVPHPHEPGHEPSAPPAEPPKPPSPPTDGGIAPGPLGERESGAHPIRPRREGHGPSNDRRRTEGLDSNPRPLPTGWPVGSFGTYSEAQQAVDMLSDDNFPVEHVTIVGVNLMEVEKVMGRLTWGRVLAGGALSGAWMGIFFGLLLGIFSEAWLGPLLVGLFMGIIFGVIAAAVPYASSQGKRDFSSTTQIVAGRYDVLCDPDHAREARDKIARYNLGTHPNRGR